MLDVLAKNIFPILFSSFFSPGILAQIPKYKVVNGAVSGENTGYYNNRPLYINNTNAFVLTGDQPVVRLVKGEFIYGSFMLAVERKGIIKWLQHCDRIISWYQTGRMSWQVSDESFPGLKVELEALPAANTIGMVIRARVEGGEETDRLIWVFGGAEWRQRQNLSWKLDVLGQPELLSWGFSAEAAKDNRVKVKGATGYISIGDSATGKPLFTVACTGSATDVPEVGDVALWENGKLFKESKRGPSPVLRGIHPLKKAATVYWTIEVLQGEDDPGSFDVDSFEKKFNEGLQRIEAFQNRLKINTPDAYLNALASASVAAVDGTWYPPVFVHGAMQWNARFPGWRTIFGGTMYGWHDRVKAEAKFYTDSQVRTNEKRSPEPDTTNQLTMQGPNSRFYGLGRIMQDQGVYNMQSQFFDQIIEEYRWTNDPGLLSFFREALELHLKWQQECFDRDGDGIYESYINVWPTDSQWYNGGGTAEETSYAYRGHAAARDMARNAGDVKAEQYHEEILNKIRRNFFETLWIKNKGYSASYRESGPHRRLHENPWLYSIFLPIEAGLTTPIQAIESLYYSEYALQNDRMPGTGRMVWTSNWVPGTWSVRERWPGDNYALALAYFKAGLPDDAWDIMRGTFMYTAFNDVVPGNLGGRQGGIDFGDCVHTFSRTLISGLFGYQPDYPNHKVMISPGFPPDWDYASIEIPDVKINFNRKKNLYQYDFVLTNKADLELHLPVYSNHIRQVKVNGSPVSWKLLPATGRSGIQIVLPSTLKAEIVIDADEFPYFAPVVAEGSIGNPMELRPERAESILKVEDPQGVFKTFKIERNILLGELANNKGHHTVLLKTKTGNTEQWRVYRIRINDPEGDRLLAARFIDEPPVNADWNCIDIQSAFNADITSIYQQKYLSPRPKTVSAQLGTDGYSPWTFKFWNSHPPEIKLNYIPDLLNENGKLITPQGVPFSWSSVAKNIAFTSLWDNYPDKTEIPINTSGNAIYFLISGSTNVMQCQIANAVVRLHYADGITDSLELVPPVNYWNLSTITANATAPGQESRNDYTAETDRFCLPDVLPQTVNLGKNCRAMLLNLKLRKGKKLKWLTLETLSQEVVVGLMGVTVLN